MGVNHKGAEAQTATPAGPSVRRDFSLANKLAGQRAKFSRARAVFYSASDEVHRQRAAQLMAEVLAEAFRPASSTGRHPAFGSIATPGREP